MPNFLSVDQTFAFLLLHDPKDVKAFAFDFDLPLHSKLSASHYHNAATPLATLQTNNAREDLSTVKVETVKDAEGTSLTIKTTSKAGEEPLEQHITIKAPAIKREFNFSGNFLYQKGKYPLQDLTGKKGTLYFRGDKPAVGKSFFNAQQYPPYDANAKNGGRVVIDFWVENPQTKEYYIAGVFKTDDDNNVSGGEGEWQEIAY